MIRQRVTRHGVIFPLPPASQLPGCALARDLVGVPKQGPVQKWLDQRKQWDRKFATAKRKVHKRFIDDLAVGYEGFGDGEFPPPSALAGRRRKGSAHAKPSKRGKSMGLAMWSLWGSKHDKMTMNREEKADREDQGVEMMGATGAGTEGEGARSFADLERQGTAAAAAAASPTSARNGRSRSRRRQVTYERQDENNENGEDQENVAAAATGGQQEQFLSPGYHPPPPQHNQPDPEVGIGTTGKRPYVDGIAVPFSLKKEAETASMMTLTSTLSLGQGGLASPRLSTTSRPMSPADRESGEAVVSNGDRDEEGKAETSPNANHETSDEVAGDGKGKGKDKEGAETAVVQDPAAAATPAERPGLETFVTAAEGLPTVQREAS